MQQLPFEAKPETQYFGFSSVSGLQAPVQRLQRHDEIELGLCEFGSVDAIIGKTRLLVPQGRLLVFWATQPHGPLMVDPGTRSHCVHIPLPSLMREGLPPKFLHHLLEGRVFLAPEGSEGILPDLLLVKHWVDLLSPGDTWSQRIVLHEVVARLMRLSTEAPVIGRSMSTIDKRTLLTGDKMRHFLRIMQLLAERCTEPWTAAAIGKKVGLHPNYAMRIFQEVSGMSIRAALIQQRIGMAQRLLCTTDMKVVDIAFECGFQNQASFYEFFTRICGKPPAKYRRIERLAGDRGW